MKLCLAIALLVSLLEIVNSRSAPASEAARRADWEWSVYGGSPGQGHYSPLKQINRSNVARLKLAWTYDTGEPGGKRQQRSLETSPIVVNGELYGYTPSQKIFALDAATGRLLWKFDSGIADDQPNRGLAYWSSGNDRRILAGIRNFVYALDADTGKPIASFGRSGRIDLRENLGRDPSSVVIALTTPGIVYQDLLIVGGMEPESLPCAPGDIRAYDIRTGELRWSFHTIPHPGEFGYGTWPKDAWKFAGAANNWAGMALDAKRGIVYVPTGSAASDFYKANELGDDLFSDCLIALDARTGRMIWFFQTVRHDLWDRDLPSAPVLVTVKQNGREVDAVAETTKSGFVYLFDRTNGHPLFPISYRKYPPSDVPNEVAAPEQPLPARPVPFSRQLLTEDMLTNRTPAAHEWALGQFKKFRSAGQFVPLTVAKKTVVFPGFDGGAEWGGPALDPETGILYVNANDVAWTGELAKTDVGETSSRSLYLNQCSPCHGDRLTGSPPDFPSLIGIGRRRSRLEITSIVRRGRGRMPGFSDLSREQVRALVDYLTTGRSEQLPSSGAASIHEPYHFSGYDRFVDPQGYPAVAPPWGTLNAIDLNTGQYRWKIPLGEYPELTRQGTSNTGTENYGGPVVTAGGLLFIAATSFDRKLRVFDKSTGKLLWETILPCAGNATPVTYEVNGRQYLAIAAGGLPSNSSQHAVYVAFALPEPRASRQATSLNPHMRNRGDLDAVTAGMPAPAIFTTRSSLHQRTVHRPPEPTRH